MGDLALKALAERLTSTMRSNDTVGRYGGDEFLLLLRDTEEHEAQRCDLLFNWYISVVTAI